MKRSRNTERPRGSTALPSRSNSMMSSALTSAGASDRDIRKRFGLVGWRALTWPKPSTTPKSARMRLPTTISSIKAGSPTGAVPPAVCACVCVKPDSSAKIAATPKRASVLVICRLPNLPSMDRLLANYPKRGGSGSPLLSPRKFPSSKEQSRLPCVSGSRGRVQMFKKDKQQQRDLFESERGFRLLVEGVADYALYMLDPTGVVTNWNIGGQRIKGYSPEEIVGRHFSCFYTEADRANGKPLRALKIAEEQGRYEEEGWRVRKDGTFFWASVIIDPIREDNKLVGFAKITRDITERREAQLKLEQMQKQLAESQKLDALGQLTGGVAHDFNNLLMIISGSVHTLKKGLGNDARLLRAVAAIETASNRGAALTSQLLTFARRQSVNPEAVDIAMRIDAVREVLDAAVGSAVTLQVDVAPDVWPVMVDVVEFETAMVNLVINARDAMVGGGVITISAHN